MFWFFYVGDHVNSRQRDWTGVSDGVNYNKGLTREQNRPSVHSTDGLIFRADGFVHSDKGDWE